MRSARMTARLLVGIALLSTSTAHAQLGGIVFDPRAFAQQLQQLDQARQQVLAAKTQVDQGLQQIAQAKQLYQSVNDATNISSIANKLKTDALRTSNVSSSNLDGFTSGNLDVVGGLRGKANDVYKDLMGRVPADASDASRSAAEQGAREAAVTTGLAGNVGDSVTSRRQGLEELRSRLATATTASERADMSARLQLEQAQMMNDQMALQAVDIQRRAKAEADYQRYIAMQKSDRASYRAGMGLN